MIGNVLIIGGAVAAIVAAILYFISYTKGETLKKYARIAYYAMFGFVILTSVFLLSSILGHNYQLAYVYDYSSNELPFHLLLSSFYAGQEGSFLLWTLFIATVGFIIKKSTEKTGYEELVMGIFSLIIFMILIMLVVKNPFMYLWDKFPAENLKHDFMPPNGKGMNPILQNYWMAIHPPLLFIGYALMTVPFAFAIAALIKKDYRDWINLSRFWTILATAFLGVGLMLGGFWAYETLGWGGFWGWDPVENSSLLPWLVAVALIHTILVQRRTGGLIKTNLFLSILGFLLVLYATFLTRSGVLGESSVHSFGDPGGLVYYILLFILLFFTVGSVALLIRSTSDMETSKLDFKLNSKEFGLTIGSIIIMAMTVIIFMGTSWPIISGLLGKAKSSIDISFYNQWNLPLAVLILITNAISVFLAWKQGSYIVAFKKSMIGFFAALVATVIIMAFGVKELKYILLGFTAFFSLFVNLEIILRRVFSEPGKIGAYLSHFGISLLLLGVLASAGYPSSKHLSLGKGESANVFGYTVTFTGKTQIEIDLKDREKFQYNLTVEKDGIKNNLNPVIYLSDFNQRTDPFFEPSIKSFVTKDIYISPKSVTISSPGSTLALQKGESKPLPYDTTKQFTFVEFEMSQHQMPGEDGGIKLGAILDFSGVIDTLYTKIEGQGNSKKPVWKKVPNSDYEIGFVDFMVGGQSGGSTQAVFSFNKPGETQKEPIETFTFEMSIKPFMNLVWLGTIALVAGFFIAMFKKPKKTKE